MIIRVWLFLLFTGSAFQGWSQTINADLIKYADTLLFNFQDNAQRVDGEWLGEEIQYDPTQSYIKFKFKVIFNFEQKGNYIYGTSFIEDKHRGSHGTMKIRGVVIGDKLHFEEYGIIDETFYEKDFVWCLRAGEFSILKEGNKITLVGLQYNGYASNTYDRCRDYVKMSVSKTAARAANDSKDAQKQLSLSNDLQVFPNPFADNTTVSYELQKEQPVHLDIFSLTGAHIETLQSGSEAQGRHEVPLNMPACAPGIYLVRLLAGNECYSKQIIKVR